MSYLIFVEFLKDLLDCLIKGFIVILLIEDGVVVGLMLNYYLKVGFKLIFVLLFDFLFLYFLFEDGGEKIVNLCYDVCNICVYVVVVNVVIEVVLFNIWMYYGYNVEFLFYFFFESCIVGEMLVFYIEECCCLMLIYVIDFYVLDLNCFFDVVSMNEVMFDCIGYFVFGWMDWDGNFLECQLDFYGGLCWCFEEYVFVDRCRIDRILLFCIQLGLKLLVDYCFNVEEYNIYFCLWYYNLMVVVVLFWVVKVLVCNFGLCYQIQNFVWCNLYLFCWYFQQLMDFGLMELGQWF